MASINFDPRHEVGIVVAATVLRVGNNAIAFTTTTAEIVLLEIATLLVKSITVEKIVNLVRRVEELSDREVDIVLGNHGRAIFALRPVLEVKDHVRATRWAEVVEPLISAFPILVRKDLKTGHVGGGSPGDTGYARCYPK